MKLDEDSFSPLFSIFILIRSLNVGGAERQVSVLAQELHRRGYKVTIGVFYTGGALEETLRKNGVAIYSLDKKGRWDLIGWFWRYLKAIRQVNPDVIYSFLTTSNIVSLIGQVFIYKPIVWGVRASNMNYEKYDWLARLTAWLEKKLSPYAQTIIFNANFSYQYYQSLGYKLHHPVVIPNGIDTNVFKPISKAEKSHLRAELGIPSDALVVGMVARFDPMKDYETFLAAARALSHRYENLYFIVAGPGTESAPWPSLPSRFYSLGTRKDVPALLNTFDIMVLSSAFGEGFPNVVGEAMACGTPAVVTDVGDACYIVGDLGVCIPPKSPEALVKAIESILQNPPAQEMIRKRIIDHFSVSQMVTKTLQILNEACVNS